MGEFQDLPESNITAILDRAFHIKNCFFDAGNDCILPQSYRKIADQVKHLKIRPDDVLLSSYPRTGSTWLQEILWLLGNDLDYVKARNTLQQLRSPILELSCLMDDEKILNDWIT